MAKIPVGETIRYAYRFTFGHLGAIIGLIWLPMVIVTIAGFFAGQRYYADAAAALMRNDYAAMGPAILMMLGYLALGLLLYAMMYAAVTELALGTRKPGEIVHFAFGRIEWRMFRAIAGFIGLLALPAAFILAVAGFISSALGHAIGQGPLSLGAGAVLLILDGSLLFVALRFGFLLAPVAAAEEGRVLEHAWTLSHGNFWRILGVLVASVAPVLLFIIGVQIALLGPRSMALNLNPTAVETASQIQRMSANMPLVAGIEFLVSPLLLGLTLSAAAFSYRALTRAGSETATPPP